MLMKLKVGAINIEFENIKFWNGEIKKQSGELKANLTKPNLTIHLGTHNGLKVGN